MATVPISLGISGDTVSAVSVTALTRSDTGTAPSGVSLPFSLTLTSGAWTGSFTEPSTLPPYYNATIQITYSDSTVQTVSGVQIFTGKQTGYYTSQSAAESIYGATNIAKWSNKGDSAAGTADLTAIQDALNRTDREFDRVFRFYKYATPIATTVVDFGNISDLAAEYMGVLLYEARGLRDNTRGAKSDPANWDGKMEGHRVHVMGDIGENLIGELQRLCMNGIQGAARLNGSFSNAPFVQMPPEYPNGAFPNNSPAQWPAQVPRTLS